MHLLNGGIDGAQSSGEVPEGLLLENQGVKRCPLYVRGPKMIGARADGLFDAIGEVLWGHPEVAGELLEGIIMFRPRESDEKPSHRIESRVPASSVDSGDWAFHDFPKALEFGGVEISHCVEVAVALRGDH